MAVRIDFFERSKAAVAGSKVRAVERGQTGVKGNGGRGCRMSHHCTRILIDRGCAVVAGASLACSAHIFSLLLMRPRIRTRTTQKCAFYRLLFGEGLKGPN